MYAQQHANSKTRPPASPEEQSKPFPFPMVYLWAFLIVAFGGLVMFPDATGVIINFVLQFLGAFIGVFVAAFILYRLLAPRLTRKLVEKEFENPRSKSLREERLLVISPEGVAVTTEWADAFTRWGGFETVVKTDAYLYVYEVTPEIAVIVPRRVFPDQQSYDEFADLAQKYHADSQDALQAPVSTSD
jgi:hypothetical protein